MATSLSEAFRRSVELVEPVLIQTVLAQAVDEAFSVSSSRQYS